MATRDKDRSQLGRLSQKSGGWAETTDDQRCPRCGKRCCGSKLSDNRITKIQAEHAQRCPEPICHRAPGYGTDHSGYGNCKGHYGSTRSNVRSAARQQVREVMRTYGVPVEIDPEDALREEIHRTVGHVRWLAEKVAGLGDEVVSEERRVIEIEAQRPRTKSGRGRTADDDEPEPSIRTELEPVTGEDRLVYGVTEREIQAGGPGGGFDRTKLATAPNVWLQIYMAERKHLAEVTKIAIAAGLETRRLDWAEAMADQLLLAFEDLAMKLGADPTAPEVRIATADALDRITARAAS